MNDITTAFNDFWQHFPRGRKTAKADARRIFIAIVKGKHKDLKATADDLMAGAVRYAAAMGCNHPFVKKPSTWLNGGCWEDDDMAPPEQQVATTAMSERVSTRERSLYDDLTDNSWAGD